MLAFPSSSLKVIQQAHSSSSNVERSIQESKLLSKKLMRRDPEEPQNQSPQRPEISRLLPRAGPGSGQSLPSQTQLSIAPDLQQYLPFKKHLSLSLIKFLLAFGCCSYVENE